MNEVIVSKERVTIRITGWDKLWSFKGSLSIPRKSIVKVSFYDGELKPPFWRCPGTEFPGVIISGTYYGRKRKEFWNTRFREGAIVMDLEDAEYTRIVVDVDDAPEVLRQLKAKR